MGVVEEKFKKLTDKEGKKLLIKSGMVFYILGGIITILGLFSLLGGAGTSSLVLIIPGIVVVIIGFKNLLLSGEKKERCLKSLLTKQELKISKGKLNKDEIEKFKFDNDPIYKDKIINNIHRNEDREYNNKIAQIENNISSATKQRENEITRIANSRWQSIGNSFSYNMTEGKVKINNTINLFSSIKGAEINAENSYRVITTNTGKSKKHVSLGKAVVGGALLGPIGAIAGGAMGKTTSSGTSTSNSIPTCNHLGVMVDIDGFKTEVVLLSSTVDQNSSSYNNSIKVAQQIVDKCHQLATTPVPKTFLKPEEEQSVLDIGKQIAQYQKDLEAAKKDVPTYDLPDIYK